MPRIGVDSGEYTGRAGSYPCSTVDTAFERFAIHNVLMQTVAADFVNK